MLRVAIIGLGFGAEFIPIYQRHPNANMYAICQRDRAEARRGRRQFGVDKRYTDYGTCSKDPDVDCGAHQLADPRPRLDALAALKAGKHVACTVPMATSVEDCKQIVEVVKKTGLQVHDGGDGGLCPRVPLHQGAVRQG